MASQLASYAQINPKLTPSDVFIFELSDPRYAGTPYVATDAYCVQPDCPCNQVFLRLERLPESPADRDPDPERVFLHLETLELTDASNEPLDPENYPLTTALMAELPKEAIELWRTHYTQGRLFGEDNAWRFRHWELEPGDMVAWLQVHETTPLWTFPFEGSRFTVIDRYCPSPTCDCREVMLSFHWSEGDLPEDEEGPEVLVRVPFKGQPVIEDDAGDRRKAERLAGAFLKRTQLMKDLKERYREIKVVGQELAQRYPELARVWYAGRPEGAASMPIADQVPEKRVKVGRNEPCPCGSGRKYKQCCGK